MPDAVIKRTMLVFQVVILDEAHERTVQTDVLLGLLKSIKVRQPPNRPGNLSMTHELPLFVRF